MVVVAAAAAAGAAVVVVVVAGLPAAELRRLCLAKELRRVAANVPDLLAVEWPCRGIDDVDIAALAVALRCNSRVTKLNICDNDGTIYAI